jgi:lysophospholipase L1-like esterase
MKCFVKLFFIFISFVSLQSCSTESAIVVSPKNYKYLALGDSYTIGQSVCETCRFPAQLKDSIGKYLGTNDTFQVKIIATTGWTTTDLKGAIANDASGTDFDLVTLLIGVNNQYQNKPFSLYEQEFPELVNTAVIKAKGDKNNLIVVSIPDYAYTPYGQGSVSISQSLQQYNQFAQNYCLANNITFVYITDITQQGLIQPALVASDGLHPSVTAYTKFVERILPIAKVKIAE